MSLDITIKQWLKCCQLSGYRFAMVRTINAVYDRVAILPAKGDAFFVEHPKKRKAGWTIASDLITRREVIAMRCYKE